MERINLGDTRTSLQIEPEFQSVLDSCLAKSGTNWHSNEKVTSQSYFEHVSEVYFVWKQLIDIHHQTIERVASSVAVSPERLMQSSLLCVAFHDFGKLTTNFLDMMNAQNAPEYRRAQKRNYRHEVVALPIVDNFARFWQSKSGAIPGNGALEVLAVAGHHRFLADGHLLCKERFSNKIVWNNPSLDNAITASVLFAKKMFQDCGWKMPVPPGIREFARCAVTAEDEKSNFPFMQLNTACNELTHQPKKHLREVFILLKSLLMVADWRASSSIDSPSMLNAATGCVGVRKSELSPFVKEKVERDGKSFSGFRNFQERCGDASGHVLAIAPTGSGKTEAAFLWALNQIESGAVQKILFLLPTMVTANSLHQRAVTFFSDVHDHKVGLVHSTADLIRAASSVNDEQQAGDLPEIQGGVLAERHFFSPVTVGTIDQLLNSLFHTGRWPMKTFAALNAAIVIDEIHAYDPHTAGLISLMLEQLSSMGSRFMVMSATLPEDLKTVVRNSLTSSNGTALTEVSDTELLSSARNDWSVREEKLTDWIMEQNNDVPSLSKQGLDFLTREIQNDKRVLIVVNTVGQCQQIAEAIRQHFPDALCYHSKFIFDDRRKLEEKITAPNSAVRILIATQVVEVSLDIDFDVLLTESAPIDALIQRAGRVNRARKKSGRINVFHHEEFADKLYDFPAGVLDRTWKLLTANQRELTESDLLRLVESAYENYDLQSDDSFVRIKDRVTERQRHLCGVLDNPRPTDEDDLLSTRLIEYPQISVVPARFESEAVKSKFKERRKFELKMPLWYVKSIDEFGESLGRYLDEHFIHICRMEYDDFLGGCQFSKAQIGSQICTEPSHFII